MKINQKYLKIGLIFLILIIGFCAYNFGYSPYQEKAEALNTEISQLKERISTLEEKCSHEEEFRKGIDNSTDIIDSVLAKYGPGNTMEKTIMMIVEMCDRTGVKVNTLSFTEPSLLFTSTASDEDGNAKIKAYTNKANVSFEVDYPSYKRVTDFINNQKERMNIDNFSLSYNQETGALNGNMLLNMYSIEDDKHEYVAPVIEGIDLGSSNLFVNTIVPTEEENAEGTEEGTTEE